MIRTRRSAATLCCLLAVGAGVTACGQEQAAVCDEVDALRTSVDNLTKANVGENGLSVISTELENVRSELRQLGQDASAQYSEQISAVRARAADLRSSVATASTDPSADSLSAVADNARAVGAAVQDLGDAVAGTC